MVVVKRAGGYIEGESGGVIRDRAMTVEQERLMMVEWEKAVLADAATEEMETMCRLRNMIERDKIQKVKSEARKARRKLKGK